MGVEGCTKCIKYLLFVFNFVFWLAGGVILGVALWLRHDNQTSSILYLQLGEKPAPSAFYMGIYILIAVGAVMMFVGFLGCFGAIQESQCLLGTFFTCLVILFACEVAAGIWGFVNKDQVRPVPSPGTTSFIQSHLSSAYYVQSTGLSARSGQFGNGERRSPPHDVPRADLCPLPPAPIHHPQIAKDVKQFYDQALTQAVIDEDTTNAKAVVKTFHETLQCCGADLLSTLTVTLVQKSLCPDGNAKLIHFTVGEAGRAGGRAGGPWPGRRRARGPRPPTPDPRDPDGGPATREGWGGGPAGWALGDPGE
uniref:Uncharacterized protein n=1 Tax=Ornithorhynchus anatinus TaxID=9258 RepID=A0A6I8P5Q1_ORNAN